MAVAVGWFACAEAIANDGSPGTARPTLLARHRMGGLEFGSLDRAARCISGRFARSVSSRHIGARRQVGRGVPPSRAGRASRCGGSRVLKPKRTTARRGRLALPYSLRGRIGACRCRSEPPTSGLPPISVVIPPISAALRESRGEKTARGRAVRPRCGCASAGLWLRPCRRARREDRRRPRRTARKRCSASSSPPSSAACRPSRPSCRPKLATGQ